MDIQAISQALTSIKSAFDISKGLLAIRDDSLLKEKVGELMDLLFAARTSAFDAQSAQSALSSRISELEKKIISFEIWDKEKENYVLNEIRAGVFVYALKKPETGVEPPHCICATCYQNRIKSILQTEIRMPGADRALVCHTCHADIYESGGRRPEHPKKATRR